MSHAITPSGRAVNPWWIGLTLTIATFMELLDTSIANVSLPHIAGGLGTSLDEATWVLTSYLVANAVVLAFERLAESCLRPKKLLHGLRRPVHHQFLPVRDGPEPRAVDFLPGTARDRRWRVSAFGTGHAGGYLSAGQTRSGFWTLQYGDRDGAGPWANAWAAGSPTILPGGGFFSSTFQSVCLSLFLTSRLVTDPPALYGRATADQGLR